MPLARAIVKGDKETIANMRRAYNSVGGRFLDQTLRESLEPMRDETERNARERRQVGYNPPGGHLDEGVVIAKRDGRSALNRTYWISFKKRARKIAHLVEYGTAPHHQPKRGIMHPGARPFPFFRPAFEARKHDVVNEVSVRTWNRIRGSLIGAFRR